MPGGCDGAYCPAWTPCGAGRAACWALGYTLGPLGPLVAVHVTSLNWQGLPADVGVAADAQHDWHARAGTAAKGLPCLLCVQVGASQIQQ